MPWDRAKYPADWSTRIVPAIRERSGNVCECRGECGRAECYEEPCKAANGKPHPVTGSLVVLTTAHLNHKPEDCDLLNLMHLCQRCHLHMDAGLHAQHARETRRRRREEAGQIRLDVDEEVPRG